MSARGRCELVEETHNDSQAYVVADVAQNLSQSSTLGICLNFAIHEHSLTAGTANFSGTRYDTESYVPVNLAHNFLAPF